MEVYIPYPFVELNFNFIMILFYFDLTPSIVNSKDLFQFHYDLILFGLTASAVKDEVRFQFHYDLILLPISFLLKQENKFISISL